MIKKFSDRDYESRQRFDSIYDCYSEDIKKYNLDEKSGILYFARDFIIKDPKVWKFLNDVLLLSTNQRMNIHTFEHLSDIQEFMEFCLSWMGRIGEHIVYELTKFTMDISQILNVIETRSGTAVMWKNGNIAETEPADYITLQQLMIEFKSLPTCGNPLCCVTSNIAEQLSFGNDDPNLEDKERDESSGSDLGYFENPCRICAQNYETHNPEYGPCCPEA